MSLDSDDVNLRVLVTSNTEYHLQNKRCVCVRDKHTGKWEPNHLAVGANLLGGVSLNAEGALLMDVGPPHLGQRLFFEGDVLTSPLCEVIQGASWVGASTWQHSQA